MQIGNGTVNGANVARIMGVTIAIAVLIDLASAYIGWRIPWYGTVAILTLFMYACESDLSYQYRAEFSDWKEEIEKRDI